MVGVFFGIAALFALPAAVLERDLEASWGGPWQAAALALAIVIGAWLVGLLLVRTVGMAAMGYMIGAIVAAILCLFTGQLAYTPVFLLHALGGWMIQHGQSYRASFQ